MTLSSEPYAVEITKCSSTTPLIVGGTVTKPGEFPHMAALGYREFGKPKFICGGSLISERYVLTAAHCKPERNPPTFVRLSDQNLVTKTDRIQDIDVNIERFIVHENYGQLKFDIGLIRLAHDVDFTETLRPACLWQTTEIESNGTVLAAGMYRI